MEQVLSVTGLIDHPILEEDRSEFRHPRDRRHVPARTLSAAVQLIDERLNRGARI
jgi:hypothetical protein